MILLNEDSVVVKAWVTMILAGMYKYKQVPNLQNLREMVAIKLAEAGYDINTEA